MLTPQQRQQMINRRWIFFAIAFFIWACIAGWTFSAFKGHLDEMGAPMLSYGGALVGEATLLMLLWMKCFDVSIKVRKWSLIGSTVLTVILCAHAGGLMGIKDGEKAQELKETKLQAMVGSTGKQLMDAIKAQNGTDMTASQRLRESRTIVKAKTEIAKSAMDKITKTLEGRDEQIMAYGVFPGWYYKGWMYIVIFAASVLLAFIPIYLHLHMQPEDVDSDFNGQSDLKQYGKVELNGQTYVSDGMGGTRAMPQQQPMMAPAYNNQMPATPLLYYGQLTNPHDFSDQQLAQMGYGRDGRMVSGLEEYFSNRAAANARAATASQGGMNG